MNTINLFKNLIVIDLLIAIVMIITSLFTPEEYVNFTLNSIVLSHQLKIRISSRVGHRFDINNRTTPSDATARPGPVPPERYRRPFNKLLQAATSCTSMIPACP